jgi:glycosyltransferase involved in cell wall biosynthesis
MSVSPDRVSIVHVVAPGRFGGLESVVELLTARQHEGARVVHVVATLEPDGREHFLVSTLRRHGIPVTEVTLESRAYIRERRELRRLLLTIRPDIVHTHGYRCDVQAGSVARQLGLRTVSTAHGLTGGGLRNRLYEWLQLQAWRRLDAVVAVSRPLASWLRSAGVSADRVHCIPNAWRSDGPILARHEARRVLHLPAEGPIIGWVGRLSREKGADVMIQALPLLRSQTARLAMVGAGREQQALLQQAERLGVADRIHWAGVVPGAGRLFRAFDCFALSSRTEGTPIALFEAIAAGTPVVATSVGGVPDVMSHAEGCLVPPENPVDLARAVDRVLLDPASAESRAMAARHRLQAEFSVAHWVEAYDAVYRSAMARTRGWSQE